MDGGTEGVEEWSEERKRRIKDRTRERKGRRIHMDGADGRNEVEKKKDEEKER